MSVLAVLAPLGRLLLERVQNIHCLLEADRINRPVGVSRVVFNYLQHAGTLPLPRLGGRVFPAKLSDPQRGTDVVFDPLRKRKEVSVGGSNPKQFLLALRPRPRHYPNSRIIVPLVK